MELGFLRDLFLDDIDQVVPIFANEGAGVRVGSGQVKLDTVLVNEVLL
jgi:hypothetical protein